MIAKLYQEIELCRRDQVLFDSLCNQQLNKGFSKRLFIPHGSETWTLKLSSKKRIEVFEMWAYPRMLQIPWTARKTNEDVQQRVGKDRVMLLVTL